MISRERKLFDKALENHFLKVSGRLLEGLMADLSTTTNQEGIDAVGKTFATMMGKLEDTMVTANSSYDAYSPEILEEAKVDCDDIILREIEALNNSYYEQVYSEMVGVFNRSQAIDSGQEEKGDESPIQVFSNRLETLRMAYESMAEYLNTGLVRK